MQTNLLYIGPLRPETLALLEALAPAEHALFVTPTRSNQLWEEVQGLFPQAQQQVMKVAEDNGELPYYEYNLPEFNASQPASGLYTLYPGLELMESSPQPLVGVDALLSELESQPPSIIVVEQPELAWPVLQVLENNPHYQHIKALWLRVGAFPLYHGMPETAKILIWCQEHGFELQARSEDDPDLPLLQISRNAYYYRWQEEAKRSAKLAKKLKIAQQEAEQQLVQQAKQQTERIKALEQQETSSQKRSENTEEQLQQQLAKLQKQLNQLTEERDALKKQLNQSLKSSHQHHQKEHEETKQQLEKTQQELGAVRKKPPEKAETKLAETQQMLNEKDATIRQLSEQLDALQQSNERFGQLESKLESLFSEQRTYIQQTTNVLGQHVTRSARQQQEEQAMINYLQYGQRPISTKLSPSYVTALLEHYDTHNPDVVVIFGAAETTELLAQRIINARAEASLIGKSGHRQEIHKEVTVSHDDLPQTIISIEHNKAASESLRESLNNKRLNPAVNVVYAPWVECQTTNEQAELFYAADTTLQRLNQWLPENARILVIVGEALPQAGHSRKIVLPLLLQQLKTQQLDIVIEGNHFPQESELVVQWGELLQTRQRSAEWFTLCTTYSLRVEG